MKAAIVGCGAIARLHGEVLKNLEGVDLAALVDSRPENARELAAALQLDEIPIYTSIQELAGAMAVDVLHLCTPHYLHQPMAVEGMELGFHIFMEKPLGIAREDFWLLARKQQESRARVGICLQNRYNEATLKAHQILAAGYLGKPVTGRAFLTWNRPAEYYKKSDWRGILEKEGGGALINQGIHTLDLLTLFMGRPVSTRAAIDNFHLEGRIEVEDTYQALIQYERGPACIYGTTAYQKDVPPLIEIQCENGFIRMEGTRLTAAADGGGCREFSFENKRTQGKAYWGSGHFECISDYYEAAAHDRPYRNDLTTAKNSFLLMLDIYQSAREKREIPFNGER